MIVNGKHYRTIWFDNGLVRMIDQNKLPFSFEILTCKTWEETAIAIKNMSVRGAGAIGVAAGFAMAQAFMAAGDANRMKYLLWARHAIEDTRPTAHDLFYATRKVFDSPNTLKAIEQAQQYAEESITECMQMGQVGEQLIQNQMGILTHCNAGWLAFVDHGSALSPLYQAKRKAKDFTVYVDETRPRNQGARLTAWELGNENIRHFIIADNAAGFMMQQGKIQMVITGADRVARNGDVANKIGTLEKAILARTFKIPFYVAVPLSTFDLNMKSGQKISVEFRHPDEVLYLSGPNSAGQIQEIRVAAPGSDALNPAFDITPAEYITGFITAKGIIAANEKDIINLSH